jgi:uncharacterized protein
LRTLWRPMARIGGALGLGAIGGAICAWIDMPLAWMIGAMIATTIASLAGARIAVPRPLRDPMMAVIGLMLGSGFTPERLAGALDWITSLVALPPYVVLVGALIYVYLRKVSRFDRRTAFFAATPGGLSEMIIMGDRMGGDIRAIALVHATRVLMIVLTVPFVARHTEGFSPVAVTAAAQMPITIPELFLLLALGAIGYVLARAVRAPSPILIGPVAGSALAHLTGLVEAPPPAVLVAAAQLVMGASVGCRFSGMPLSQVALTLVLGIGSTAIMLVVTLIVGFGLHHFTGLPLLELVLAFIPGGLPEMSLTALALGVDPAYVVTHHTFRIALVVALAPWLVRLVKPERDDRQEGDDGAAGQAPGRGM